MALLYGRAGRLTAKNGGFWPGQAVAADPGVFAQMEAFLAANFEGWDGIAVEQRFALARITSAASHNAGEGFGGLWAHFVAVDSVWPTAGGRG